MVMKLQNSEHHINEVKLSDDGIGIVDIHQKQKHEIKFQLQLICMLNGDVLSDMFSQVITVW